MPTQPLVRITSWSYSRFGTYQQCPFKAKLQYIDKLKEPDHPAGANGTRVHELADTYVTGRITLERENEHLRPELEKALKAKRIPQELACFEKEFQLMQKLGVNVKALWTFDRDWEYLPPPNGWFSPRAWLRIKVDNFYLTEKKLKGGRRESTVHIIDYK